METMREKKIRLARDIMRDVDNQSDGAIFWAAVVLSVLSQGDEAHRAIDMQKLIAGEHSQIAPTAPIEALLS